MTDSNSSSRLPSRSAGLASGIVTILLTGATLGLVYNAFGLGAEPPWGLRWLAEDRLSSLEKVVVDSGLADGPSQDPSYGSYSTGLDDPLAIPGEALAATAELPEIPAVGRPVQIDLGALRRYFEEDAALIVDARDPQDYAAGHIRGAINLPYDEVISNPSMIEALRTAGRPIVTYCGGEGCEVSLGVAEELCAAGHQRVAVYVGGFPEWVDAGQPVGRNVATQEGEH
jgi:rhodanese-related sulfurtransferase